MSRGLTLAGFHIPVLRRGGFTLLELLVVLVLLGLLAGLVGPRVLMQLEGSRHKAAALQIEEFKAALALYQLDVGRYPSTREGLVALVEKPPDVKSWKGPYLGNRFVDLDPWGNPYGYVAPGSYSDYDLYTLGADGREGGDGENADIVSWE